MTPGTTVKALKNYNRVEEGTHGEVVANPKTFFGNPEEWTWVKFSKIHDLKLMKLSELEVIRNDMFYG